MFRFSFVAGFALVASCAFAGGWTKLVNPFPDGAQGYSFKLLTDGRVLAENGEGPGWYILTPDAKGSYINGTWSATTPMETHRFSFPSEILPDGRVWILGGEDYGPNIDSVWTGTGEIWDPGSDTWAPISNFPPQSCFQVTYNDIQGNTTTGSNVLTNLPPYVTPTFLVGWTVTGPGIPAGTTVTAVDSNTQLELSSNATANQTQVGLSFSGVPESCFGDDPTMLLDGGNILTGSLVSPGSYLYSIANNSWTFAANKVYNDSSDEETWTKLADGRVLTYDIGQSVRSGEGYAEVYDPVANTWSSVSPGDGTAKGTLPLLSNSSSYELGPALRLLDGRTFFIGATGHTALYTPSTNTWAAGPDIMGKLHSGSALFGADDAAAAILPNGEVVLAADSGPTTIVSSGNATVGSNVITKVPSTAEFYVGWPVDQTSGTSVIPPGSYITSVDSSTQIHISQNATGTAAGVGLQLGGPYSAPTELFIFNPAKNTITQLAIPDTFLPTESAYNTNMLILPNGQLLFADGSYQPWIYGSPATSAVAYRPVIKSISYSGSGVFTLSGTQITGQSAGASYGDDAEMDENFPVVRLQDSSGDVFYCKTTNWSTTKVATGSLPETANFTLNANVTPGKYTAIVSAAGISSNPFAITITAAEIAGQ